MTTITRRQFVRAMQDRTLTQQDVERIIADIEKRLDPERKPPLAPEERQRLERELNTVRGRMAADKNHDGRIEGEQEMRALFDLIDRVDHNGRRRSIRTQRRRSRSPRTAGSLYETPGASRASSTLTASGHVLVAVARQAGADNLASNAMMNDDILFVGMNPGARRELGTLRARSRTGSVTGGMVHSSPGKLTINGNEYDLTTNQGIRDFVNSLNLPSEVAEEVMKAIKAAPDKARDELALIALHWAPAERGEPIPSRLVISGHHNPSHHGDPMELPEDQHINDPDLRYVRAGRPVFGNDYHNVQLDLPSLAALAKAMPHAAAQIEDIAFAACNSLHPLDLERLGLDEEGHRSTIFPNLRTVWGYRDKAPLANLGGDRHLRVWERRTRGRARNLDPNPRRPGEELGKHDRSVATWDRHGGIARPPRPGDAGGPYQ